VLHKEVVVVFAAFFLCSLGFGAVMLGYGLSWLLHRRWSGRTATADAVTAVAIAVVCAITMASLRVDASRGPIWIGIIALLSVVIRHVARQLAMQRDFGAAA
jgi:hypothetical protein